MQQDPFSSYTPRPAYPRPKRSSGGIVALCLIVAIAAGLLGGAVTYFMLNRADPVYGGGQRPSVTLSMAPTSAAQQGESTVYSSIIEEVVAAAAPSVVEVTTESKVTSAFFGSFITSGAGSGVIFSADGYIVTNHHVVEGSTAISVRTYDGVEYPATLIGSDAQNDLAVIKINTNGLIPATLGDSDTIVVGQLAIAIGNPLGTLGGTVTEGIISARDRELTIEGEAMTLLQTSAAINHGNSGGGLFDRHGHLVGVVNAKSSGSDIEGLGFAIPINTVIPTVRDLIEHGFVTGRPVLGIRVATIASRSDMYRYGVSRTGLYVSGTTKGSLLESGDRILSIDGQQVQSAADIRRLVSLHQVGDTITVTVSRNGRQLEQSITLIEKTSELSDADIL